MNTILQMNEFHRVAVLQCLRNNGTRFGLPAAAIRSWAIANRGLDPSEDQVLDALDYLETRPEPLIEGVLKVVSAENRAWRITTAGRAYLDERNL